LEEKRCLKRRMEDFREAMRLKDKFGLSWQIWPTVIGEMMKHGTREQIDRITQAFLPMKKFDLATLQKAYEGK